MQLEIQAKARYHSRRWEFRMGSMLPSRSRIVFVPEQRYRHLGVTALSAWGNGHAHRASTTQVTSVTTC